MIRLLLERGEQDRARHRAEELIRFCEFACKYAQPQGRILRKIKLHIEHYNHPLHIYCRLIDIGVAPGHAARLGRMYERGLKWMAGLQKRFR